ncbi:MAG: hypothetical protein JWO52_339, partial [Gammaproteobacteria bacterium]|nr:hypothetical protein [Gammaproteobacteria bacterium]
MVNEGDQCVCAGENQERVRKISV